MTLLKLPAIVMVCHLLSVFSSLVPAAQHGSVTNVTLIGLHPADSSNLNLPPPIPGFEARLVFDRKPTLDLWQVYVNAIHMMHQLALLSSDGLLTIRIQIMGINYNAESLLSPWPHLHSGLQVKHGVMAIYQAGVALAGKPIRVGPGALVPRLFAGLFLENQQIGFLKWAHTSGALDSEGNGTLSRMNTGNATSAAQPDCSDTPTNVAAGTGGVVVDPADNKFKITYRIGNQEAHLPEIFSAFLEAMATAASNDTSGVGGFVNAVGVAGDIAVNLHGTGVPSTLSWGRLINSLVLIWDHVITTRCNWMEMDFDLSYDGEMMGQGFIFNITRPGNGWASS